MVISTVTTTTTYCISGTTFILAFNSFNNRRNTYPGDNQIK